MLVDRCHGDHDLSVVSLPLADVPKAAWALARFQNWLYRACCDDDVPALRVLGDAVGLVVERLLRSVLRVAVAFARRT